MSTTASYRMRVSTALCLLAVIGQLVLLLTWPETRDLAVLPPLLILVALWLEWQESAGRKPSSPVEDGEL